VLLHSPTGQDNENQPQLRLRSASARQAKPLCHRAHRCGRSATLLMAGAKKNGWTVISMKNDWKAIFPFESK
jgi:hypothetical protein